MATHNVFVYGTLKRDEPNYHWLTDKSKGVAKFIGRAETVKKFPLVIWTQYNIPFLLDSPGIGNNIIGEAYEVDQPMLENLDVLEGYPNFYIRRTEDVKVIDNNGLIISCWMYTLPNFKPEMLEQKYINEYSTSGPHGLKYSDRYLKDPSFNIRKVVRVNPESSIKK